MKKLVLLLLFAALNCAHFSQHIKPIDDNDTRYKLYRQTIKKSVRVGWTTYNNQIYNKQYSPINKWDLDNMWFQGFYGTYLGLNYHTSDKNLVAIRQWVNGLKSMLARSKGIYLRDNNEDVYREYLKGHTHIEASKDQILGLVTGMLMIYAHVQDKEIKETLRGLAKNLHEQLLKDSFNLYNRAAKRYYNSAYGVYKHYFGVSLALRYIRGMTDEAGTPELTESIFKELVFLFVRYKRRSMHKDIKIGDIPIQNLPTLKEQKWWQDTVRELYRDEQYAVNLYFYELLIGCTVNKAVANQTIKCLEDSESMTLKHLNLAALYLYCGNKWNLPLAQKAFYEKVLTRDNTLHPKVLVPNSKNYGAPCKPYETFCHEMRTDYKLTFDSNWGVSSITTKTIVDLENESINSKVHIDNGLLYNVRYLLRRVRNK
jgi:hypothetical protein